MYTIRDENGTLDLTADNYPTLLAHHGHTPDQIVQDDGDPTNLPARIRQNLLASHRRTPARYRAAMPTHPAVREWADTITTGTTPTRATGAPQIAVGPSLFLMGPTGSGKTYESHGALRLIAAYGAYGTIRSISTADLYAEVRPSAGGTEAFDRYATTSLLLLDDLGAAKPSEWTEEITYRLINYRYEAMLPTILTSNLEPRKLTEYLGDRVTSRLTEMCQRVALKTPDRRREQQA